LLVSHKIFLFTPRLTTNFYHRSLVSLLLFVNEAAVNISRSINKVGVSHGYESEDGFLLGYDVMYVGT